METAGLVQRLWLLPDTEAACVWIGPTPSNSEMFLIIRETNDSAGTGAFKNSMIDALMTAAFSRREVVAVHDEDNSRITALRVDPA